MARRLDGLEALRDTLGPGAVVRRLDVTQDQGAARFDELLDELGGVDLVIISAGTGHNHRELDAVLDVETVIVNALGFMTMAHVAVRHFLKRSRGHLVGISSIAALCGHGAGASYAASKTFQSVYLDGLRDLVRRT